MKKALLVDGNSLIFRAFYATNQTNLMKKNSNGEYTNAVLGFINMFESILENNYDYVFVAFDTDKKTFRHEMYSEYKKGRADFPHELENQFKIVYEYIEKRGACYYFFEGLEADDLIGTMTSQFKENNIFCEIFSSDHDFLQLIDENVNVNIIVKGVKNTKRYDISTFFTEYGIYPNQFIEYKAILGDNSDNIKGISGVGPKTASSLLLKYKTIDNIYNNIDDLKEELRNKFLEFRDNIQTNLTLVTIRCNEFFPINYSTCIFKNKERDSLIDFYRRYDLKRYIPRTYLDINYEIVSNIDDYPDLFTKSSSLYFEFEDVNYQRSDIYGIGLNDGERSYFLKKEFLRDERFIAYLSSDSTKKIVFDLKATYVYLKKKNITLRGVKYDYLLCSYLLFQNNMKTNLSEIASSILDSNIEIDKNIYNNKEEFSFQKVMQTISKKAEFLYKNTSQLVKQLGEYNQLFLLDLEMKLSIVLAKMELEGIKIDTSELYTLQEKYKNEIDIVTEEIYRIANKKFNISSPNQLSIVLFNDLDITYPEKNPKKLSTAIDILEKIEHSHPIVSKVILYRKLTKIYSTYLLGIEENLFSDNKLHTIYTQAITQTGRLSSILPNIQNIPVRDESCKEIRKLFIPSQKSNYLLSCDYSQIELRVLAQIANVAKLKEAFLEKRDIHEETAKLIFKTQVISKEQRQKAKAINFGIIYGMSTYGLATEIKVSNSEAKQFMDEYFSVYPEILEYQKNTILDCEKDEFVLTLLNRRRYIEGINSSNQLVKQSSNRNAINSRIQGSAADIIKVAMVKLDEFLTENNLKSKIILQIHDELILDVYEDELKLLVEKVPLIMQDFPEIEVPLETSRDYAKNWYLLK
ncbi:MAG: DNA polymerase I [Acholeplasmatales bacterium]|jgi:DNA polymerase-1|nr:DNA polymerase I [Acholeplasmatales bacterium]